MFEQKFQKYFNFSDLLLIGALFIALSLVWNTVTAMQRNYRLQQRYDTLQSSIELQELENENLKYTIQYLKSDDYLELEARDKFNKTTTGETLVYLPDRGEKLSPVAKSSSKIPKDTEVETKGWQANVQSWWRFLQGKNMPQKPAG